MMSSVFEEISLGNPLRLGIVTNQVAVFIEGRSGLIALRSCFYNSVVLSYYVGGVVYS